MSERQVARELWELWVRSYGETGARRLCASSGLLPPSRLSQEVRALLVPAQNGASAPVLHDEIAIQKFVEQDCGADGWAIVSGQLVAFRDNGDGTKTTIKKYDVSPYGTA